MRLRWLTLLLLVLACGTARAQNTGCLHNTQIQAMQDGTTYTPQVQNASAPHVCQDQSSPPVTFQQKLYWDGSTASNTLATVSAAHSTALLNAVSNMACLNPSGSVCTCPAIGAQTQSCAKVVVLQGFSNAGDEDCTEGIPGLNVHYPYTGKCGTSLNTFIPDVAAQQTGVTPFIDPNLMIVNCNFGGYTTDTWTELLSGGGLSPWGYCTGTVPTGGTNQTGVFANTGFDTRQVQIAIQKVANVYPWSSGPNPGANGLDNNVANHRNQLSQLGHNPPTTADLPSGFGGTSPAGRTGGSEVAWTLWELGQLARLEPVAFPHIKALFLYSRMNGGTKAITGISAEPYAMEYDFAIQWLIKAQILQADNGGSADAVAGSLAYNVAPVIGRDYPIWAGECGVNARADGLCYTSTDMQSDGAHPACGASCKINLGKSGTGSPTCVCSGSGFGQGRLSFWETDPYFTPWTLTVPLVPTPTPTPTITPTPTPTPTVAANLFVTNATPSATPTPTSSPTPLGPALYYLGGPGQGGTQGTQTFAAFPSMATATHGNLNVACRAIWRYVQPTNSGFNWTYTDACQTAAANAGTKWSLSMRLTPPLWMFDSSCPATPNTCLVKQGESAPGSGSLASFPFTWTQNYECPTSSTQCIGIEYRANFLAAAKTFVDAVATRYAADTTLDHVIVTGENYITQENSNPRQAVDKVNWVPILAADGVTCSSAATTCAAYNSTMDAAYNSAAPNNFIGIWNGDFPSRKLGSMFINGPAFPWQNSSAFGLQLLNDLVATDSTRSIVYNNAANITVDATTHVQTAVLDNQILCYQGINTAGRCPSPMPTKSATGLQEGPSSGVGGIGVGTFCAVPTGQSVNNVQFLINAATAANVSILEIYQPDQACL